MNNLEYFRDVTSVAGVLIMSWCAIQLVANDEKKCPDDIP